MNLYVQKNKFFKILKDIFVGENIEGESGYVNLMRIKNKYYQKFEAELANSVKQKIQELKQNANESIEEEIYNKLFTFFSKYVSPSGSIFFNATALHDKIYERIYKDEQDVSLFWKTNMLYYVKTERLFKHFEVQISGIWYVFDVQQLELKQNNEKKELIFEFLNTEKQAEPSKISVFLAVKYAQKGNKTKTDEITKQIKQTIQGVTEKHLENAIATFKKQSEVDFFINKNAKQFLREQFSNYIKNYLLDDETMFNQNRLQQIKVLQEIALNIIELVSQFEDELLRIWRKPKFAHSANYVITLDKIAKNKSILDQMLTHTNLHAQIQEWVDLGMISPDFESKQLFESNMLGQDLNPNYWFLPVDTKYFKDLELDILAIFDNLDSELNGWLIHSENYQALNTLQDKFKQKIQTIYIDPPYNTGSDGFIYSDKFQNSSWLSFMQDRLDFSKIFLNETGSLFVSIGDTIKSGHVVNSNSKMQLLMSQIFGEQNYIANFIRRSSSAPKLDAKHISNAHDYVVAYAKNINDLHLNKKLANLDRFTEIDFHIKSRGKYALNKLDRGSLEYSKSLDFAIISPENTEIWPNGTEDDIRWIWRWSKDKIQWGIENDYIVFKKSKNNKWQVYYKEYELVDNELNIRERENPYHTFIDGFFNEFGNKEIEDLFQLRLFEYPKPSNLVKYILEIASQTNSFILDFFAGSGTTAHATIELNKKDGGTRKYLLIEMGEHFDKVIVPRLKKVCFSDQWKDGKAQPKGKGVSQFFKYFSLEQYEETLALSKYEDKNPLPDNIYSQYLFFKDLKLAPLAFENDSAEFRVDLRSLHPKIDIAETLSHLLGKMIAKINKDSVVFSDGTVIDLENLDYKYIKRLIWW